MNDLRVATAYGSVQRPHTVDVHVLYHRSPLHEQLKPEDQNSLKSPVHLHTSVTHVVHSQTASLSRRASL